MYICIYSIYHKSLMATHIFTSVEVTFFSYLQFSRKNEQPYRANKSEQPKAHLTLTYEHHTIQLKHLQIAIVLYQILEIFCRKTVMRTKLLSLHFILASLAHAHTHSCTRARCMHPGCRPGVAAAAACGCRCFVLKL